MYSFCCKHNVLLMISRKVFTIRASIRSITLFGNFQHCQKSKLVRLFSASTLDDKQSFTVSYLVNSCGFSLEDAKSVSTKVQLRNSIKPDSVLVSLRTYGFTDTYITILVKRLPRVLFANSEKTLNPKLEFLNSIGISSNVLVKLVSQNPYIFRSSLENRIIPFYKFLKNIVNSDEKVVKAYIRMYRYSSHDVQKNFAPNIGFLKKLGVPESSIFAILLVAPRVVFRERHVFEKIVTEVYSKGYDPKTAQFVSAARVFLSLSKSTLECKMEMYKRWGWSENELDFALMNYPTVFCISEKKTSKILDFLVNKMGYKSGDIARSPIILSYSLERRIIPRCLVLKVLLLKGLLMKKVMVSSLIAYSSKQFEKFINRYNEEVPQLLNFYEGNSTLSQLGFSSDDVDGVKHCNCK